MTAWISKTFSNLRPEKQFRFPCETVTSYVLYVNTDKLREKRGAVARKKQKELDFLKTQMEQDLAVSH